MDFRPQIRTMFRRSRKDLHRGVIIDTAQLARAGYSQPHADSKSRRPLRSMLLRDVCICMPELAGMNSSRRRCVA